MSECRSAREAAQRRHAHRASVRRIAPQRVHRQWYLGDDAECRDCRLTHNNLLSIGAAAPQKQLHLTRSRCAGQNYSHDSHNSQCHHPCPPPPPWWRCGGGGGGGGGVPAGCGPVLSNAWLTWPKMSFTPLAAPCTPDMLTSAIIATSNPYSSKSWPHSFWIRRRSFAVSLTGILLIELL
jgi:hypothetical protein